VQGTRVGQGSAYGENTADKSIANSNYNALETTLKYQRGCFVISSELYLCEIDRSGIESWRAARSNQPAQFANNLRIRSETRLRSNLQHQIFPLECLLKRTNRWTTEWSLSGTTRFSSGLPVTLSDNSDNSYLGTLGNGANNFLIDTPRYLPGALHINKDGRNGNPVQHSTFPEELPGQQGNAKRRIFYGPGIDNYDASLQKTIRIRESKSLALRLEAFNVFNHAQFFGPAAVDGQEEDPHFGNIVSAASPRLVQLAAKFAF
jgi:hypothetical protein